MISKLRLLKYIAFFYFVVQSTVFSEIVNQIKVKITNFIRNDNNVC